MSEKPTDTPWFVHDYTSVAVSLSPANITVSCDHPAEITICSMGRALTADLAEARANARRIVRCVNAHDDLVAALELLCTFAWSALIAETAEIREEMNRRIGVARAALAKARGEQS